MKRYINNNFADDYKHECIQLILRNPYTSKIKAIQSESIQMLTVIATTWNVSYNTPASEELLKEWLSFNKESP